MSPEAKVTKVRNRRERRESRVSNALLEFANGISDTVCPEEMSAWASDGADVMLDATDISFWSSSPDVSVVSASWPFCRFLPISAIARAFS
jgi:hypothetical protein